MTELFSELKATGKLDAAKHLDLLKIKCFSRDTLVHTATGPRPIGEIEPGEQIWSYHFERGVWGLCEVKERLDNTYSGPVISITVDSTTIEATAYHPFWVIDGRDLRERSKPRELQEHEDEGHSLPGRWVNSHELRAGDCIITRSGTLAIITEIRQRFDDAFPVSNLSIIGHHNYAVGDVGVLVHNITVCEETLKDLRELYANGKGKSPDELRELLRSQKDEKGNRLYNEDEIDDAMGKVLGKKKGSANPAVRNASGRGSTLHSDKPGHLPDQLRQQYPDTEFEFTKPGVAGQDVTVVDGTHPSDYPGSTWPEGVDFGDFKPDTPTGLKTFLSDQRRKWNDPTHRLPYDPKTGRLK